MLCPDCGQDNPTESHFCNSCTARLEENPSARRAGSNPDETSTITTGTAKITFRMPAAVTLSDVRSSLTTTSSSGLPTVDINEDGATILSTKLSIDVGELTSTTADDAPVISDVNIADDAEITIDIDISGTGAAGLKVTFIGTYV